MDSFRSHPWQRLTLAAVIAVGIALSAILAVHFSNTQIEERRHQLMVEATTFTGDLEQYLQSCEMIAKTVGAIFEVPDLSMPRPLASIGKKVLALTPEIGLVAWIPQVDRSRIQEVLNALSRPDGRHDYSGRTLKRWMLPIRVERYTRLWTLNRSPTTTRPGLGWTSVSPLYARQPSNEPAMNNV